MKSLIVILICGLMIAAAVGEAVSQEVVVVNMKVTKIGFDPAEVTVDKGQTVVLKITAVDRDHGIVIPRLGVPRTLLPKGEEVEVKFTASKPGTYRFKCSVRCGWRHVLGWVSGNIIVK